MPFDKVTEMMGEMVSVQTNQETVRRLTEQIGSWMEAVQTVEIDAHSEPELVEEMPPLHRCAFSADGAMISLVNKQWVETRTVAIGEPQEKRGAQGEREIHVGKLSYFSRLADASTFTNLAEVELRRRKVAQAREVCAVMDGADWCQLFTERHRPDAVRILDFPHAAEHVTKLLEALEQASMRIPPHMLDRCLHILKHRGPRPLLRMADRLKSDLAQQKGIQEHLAYLRKREALMQYPAFRQQGWPIGSGMVESANKNVVEARLKGAGMHWERKNVNPMLVLRNAICNDRWPEMWQKAVLHHRKQQALQRSARAEQRVQAFHAIDHASSAESPPQSTSVSKPFSSPSFQPASQKRAVAAPSATLPSISGSCTHHTPRGARVKHSSKGSGKVIPETCLLCGTVLVQLRGRTRRYCSDRCRVRAYYQRQATTKPLTAPLVPVSQAGKAPLARASGVSQEACLCCGTSIGQSRSRTKRYCSDRCRVRAFHQRQVNAKLSSTSDDPTSREVKASQQRSSEARAEACLCCGTAIEQGRRTKRYCSDRCRVRAFHQRQAKME